MAGYTFNGRSLRDLGVIVRNAPGLRNPATRQVLTVPIVGTIGAAPVGLTAGQAGDLAFSGWLVRDTFALRSALEDTIKGIGSQGLVTIVRDDGYSVRRIDAVQGSLVIAPPDPEGRVRAAAFSARWVAPAATWRDVEPKILSMPTAGTRYTINGLGTAPSQWLLRIVGAATNPTVTYRNAAGVALWAIAFGATSLTGTTDELWLDSRTGLITKYASGTPTASNNAITSGGQDWPRGLDPLDGDPDTSQYPTLDVSSGTAVLNWWIRNL